MSSAGIWAWNGSGGRANEARCSNAHNRQGSRKGCVPMLSNSVLIAFAATIDGAKARAFYEDVLGLRVITDDDFAVVLDANGTELRIQKVRSLTPQPHTQLGWLIPSISAVVRALRERGITFELFPSLQQDADG